MALLCLACFSPALLRAQCNPQFSWASAPSGNDLLKVNFTNTSPGSYPPGSVPHFTLYFGDNSSQHNFNTTTSHNYAAPGTYNAMLRIELHDSLNPAATCIDTIFHQVTVGYSPCATYVTTINNGGGSFTMSATTPAGTPGMTYSWNFGDGGTATGSPVTHTYAVGGSYNLTLQATGGGCTYNNGQNIYIPGLNCDSLHANFYATVSGSTAQFINTSTSSTTAFINGASWSFGDGGSSTQLQPLHTYAAPGTYTVTLINRWVDSMTMTQYCSDTITHNITITGGGSSNVCDSLHADYTVSLLGGTTAQFHNTSNALNNVFVSSASWHFGDGSTSTQYSPSHTYAAPGVYAVTLISNWTDSLNMTQICSDSVTYNITITGGGSSNVCDSLHANFTYAVSGNTVNFTNTSNSVGTMALNGTNWHFGDGTSSSLYHPSHTYSAPGSYTVTLFDTWVDSFTMAQYCHDSISYTIVVGGQNNEISGNIYYDSLSIGNPTDSFKVWLIRYDSTANTLTAIDSLYRSIYNPHYGFHNAPAGTYYVKAAVLGQTPGTTGFIPTYHYSSPYWGSATPIFHSGGASLHRDIVMLTGTVTSGPGFVGGNISMGAGKGTATGVADMLVLLRDNTNKVIASVYTNADGDYAFSNIPEGSYTVYPEAMNYRTTPSATITLAAGHYSSNGNDFGQTEDEIIPKHGLGISRLGKEDGINVYPNPVTQTLYLDCKNGKYSELSLVNVLGQTVYHQPIHSGINKVETGHLNAGIYYLLIKGSEGARSMQISKQ